VVASALSNLDPEGRVLARADRRNLFNLGNQLWNTDSSFKRIPAKCSLLSAGELPSPGPIDMAKGTVSLRWGPDRRQLDPTPNQGAFLIRLRLSRRYHRPPLRREYWRRELKAIRIIIQRQCLT